MKKILNNLWHKSFYMTGLGIAAVMGGLLSANVQAAIPDSNTNAITGCYAQSGGATRIIDAQNGDTCTGSENTMTWPASAPQIAYLQLNSDGTIDTSYSKNIQSVTLVANEGLTSYSACVKVNFDPKAGMSDVLTVIVKKVAIGNQALIDICGSATLYNAAIPSVASYDNPDLNYSNVNAMFFN